MSMIDLIRMSIWPLLATHPFSKFTHFCLVCEQAIFSPLLGKSSSFSTPFPANLLPPFIQCFTFLHLAYQWKSERIGVNNIIINNQSVLESTNYNMIMIHCFGHMIKVKIIPHCIQPCDFQSIWLWVVINSVWRRPTNLVPKSDLFPLIIHHDVTMCSSRSLIC